MPETSQDAYELLHPKRQPISAQELRSRSNSVKGRNSTPTTIDMLAAESNFWPSDNRREPKISVSEFDSYITPSDHSYGYKRESSHR